MTDSTCDISSDEIYNILRHIRDPEHPLTLEDLRVLDATAIEVFPAARRVVVTYTPTINTCSLALIIGLSIKVQLKRCLPLGWAADVLCREGTHENTKELNKQVNDKERCCAALENPRLRTLVNQCLRDALR